MGTIPKWPQKKLPQYGTNSKAKKQKNTTLWEQFQNGHNFFPHYGNNSKMTTHKIPHYGNNSKMKKNTTLWEQLKK
jgi:hypothetical protein